ncbi:MAG: family 78 glycoside hydrolase catalytic domain [Eubacteriales bacterium]|nr:family 78 glycoside hydrolase catalytic domain [Eubacteriales bacterium]
MSMKLQAQWIRPETDMGGICPVFSRQFPVSGTLKKASLSITAMGVYEAVLNGTRVGDFILAPGWTSYDTRLQVQTYDVTGLLKEENELAVTVGKGWYRGRLPGWLSEERKNRLAALSAGLIAELSLEYEDGRQETISTDSSWAAAESCVRFSEIYDGETYDAAFDTASTKKPAQVFDGPTDTLIAQQGEKVTEQERIFPARIFTTPAGETVVDFGQEITGYVEICVDAKKGDCVELSHAEVMDKEGNFYTENYRGAKAKYLYFCEDGRQSYRPKLTFYGFRYIRVDRFPGGPENAKPENFTAVVLCSDMERTGYLSSSNPLLNKLFDNIIWGQKGNFVDVPTDCPQRDERLGWTGDAQAFIRTACYNFDTETFFRKWLADLSADQREDGMVGHVIPTVTEDQQSSAAWADAATICPWEVYQAFGDPDILKSQFDSMKKWVGYITSHTADPYLWTGGVHFGDWLGLDAPSGSYKGSTREDFIASAFYAHSTDLVIRAGKVLGEDVSAYEALYENIVKAFRAAYPVYTTQTECVLAAHFKLAPDCQAAADQLAKMVTDCGTQLQTGFVGTPYLLHVLSAYGYTQLAWSLLLREKYPSWLYPVTKGATTIWEHWDGIMENGDFWSSDMNSFNHYAYGAVADWVYSTAAGITPLPGYPGYEKVSFAPHPDERLGWLSCTLKTRHGLVSSKWSREGQKWRYEIETPVDAVVTIAGKAFQVEKGSWIFFSD